MRSIVERPQRARNHARRFIPGKLYFHLPTKTTVLCTGGFGVYVDLTLPLHRVSKAYAPGVALAPHFKGDWRLTTPENYLNFAGSLELSNG